MTSFSVRMRSMKSYNHLNCVNLLFIEFKFTVHHACLLKNCFFTHIIRYIILIIIFIIFYKNFENNVYEQIIC